MTPFIKYLTRLVNKTGFSFVMGKVSGKNNVLQTTKNDRLNPAFLYIEPL